MLLQLLSQQLASFVNGWVENEEGQDLIEYALIIVLVVLVVVAALTALGGQVTGVFNQITAALGG